MFCNRGSNDILNCGGDTMQIDLDIVEKCKQMQLIQPQLQLQLGMSLQRPLN